MGGESRAPLVRNPPIFALKGHLLSGTSGPCVLRHPWRNRSQELGVAESTLRYRLKRRAEGAVDGRRHKPEACAAHDGVIQAWLQSQQERLEKAGGRYLRRRRRPPKVRPLRRVEVRPGSQAQVDWVEPWVHVRELGGRTRLNGLQPVTQLFTFSPMWSVQWRLDQSRPTQAKGTPYSRPSKRTSAGARPTPVPADPRSSASRPGSRSARGSGSDSVWATHHDFAVRSNATCGVPIQFGLGV